MLNDELRRSLTERQAPLEMSRDEFRKAGHQLVDQIAEFLETLPDRKVVETKSVADIKALVGSASLPHNGTDATDLLRETTELLARHSLFNGHPGFWGYITSSAAPIGVLGDFLASAMNQNVGAWQLAPVATEIELQTIRWIADFIGYPQSCGGLMVSGGNMANFVGFLAGQRSRTPWNLRKEGIQNTGARLRVYCSDATHTWVQKAADLFGLGTDAIGWVQSDFDQRMDVDKLGEQIRTDVNGGCTPLLVVASAGTVATGAVDPIGEIADLCDKHNLWLHVDGAYGAMATSVPGAAQDLKAISRADSVALDPHKWLYAPLEAGCTLVKNPQDLPDTFSFHPDYYKFDVPGEDPATNFYEFGLQNSRGFRALKVWLAFKQVGVDAFIDMIHEDILLAQAMYEAVQNHPQLEALTCHLSITTFRYVPDDMVESRDEHLDYLNTLNEALLTRLQQEGEMFVSNAVLKGIYALRACIVNFRTTLRHVEELPHLVARIGRQVDAELRKANAGA